MPVAIRPSRHVRGNRPHRPGGAVAQYLIIVLGTMLAALTCPGKTPAAAEGPLTPWPHLVEAPTARPLQDWLAPATGHDMPVRPENATRALQTPPAFTWPDHRRHEGRQGQDRLPHAPYEFRLTLADGRVQIGRAHV